jgi:hypothetical protein
MTRHSIARKLTATVLAALMASPAAFAAPFAIQYTGTVGGSDIPPVGPGRTYTVTVVMDNGGATALNQAWVAADLRCAYFAVSGAAFAQNLLTTPATTVTGSATTDGAGALTANFTEITSSPGAGTSVGFSPPLTPPVDWFMNDVNDVFYDDSQNRSFGDAAGGVQMAAGNWTNPAPFSGACTAAAAPGFLGVGSAIPTVSQWSMAILASLLALGGMFALRRRRPF